MICSTCHKNLPEFMFYPKYIEMGIYICADCKREVHKKKNRSTPSKYVKLEGEQLAKRKAATKKWRDKVSKEARDSLIHEYLLSLQDESITEEREALEVTLQHGDNQTDPSEEAV